MNKRVVYGGGGIMPDIFVPIDTALSSDYFGKLVRKGVLNTYALSYVDRNRNALLQKHRTVDDFRRDFRMDEAMTTELVEHARKEGVEADSTGLRTSEPLIALRVKALVARDLWDTSAYWQTINPENPVDQSYQRALEVLHDDTFKRLKLAAH